MNYWLFQVMYGRFDYWEVMVKAGIAAQQYPPGWTNELRNIKALSQLSRGDVIVAAFRRHRFAGYGTLTSDFYRDGPSLEIYDPRYDRYLEFKERFNCNWTVIPFESNKIFIHCNELKKQGFNIDMIHGLCVKQIDEGTFRKLRSRLDGAGAKRFPYQALARGAMAELVDVTLEDLDSDEARLKSGAGFGDPDTNKRVEQAAVAFATKWYEERGWSVQSVEAKRCGYDLLCTKDTVEENVEVKGVQGKESSFFITVGEVQQARTNAHFVICVVTSALSDNPLLSRYSGVELIKNFSLEPVLFRASLHN